MQPCPNCQSEDLEQSERSGVKTNYCPQCNTWLDEKQGGDAEKRSRIKDTSELEEKPPMPPPVEDAQNKKNM